MNEHKNQIIEKLKGFSDKLDLTNPELSVILAAGHGKRIKSEKSKVLHEIWEKPSVWRVTESALKGLESPNQVIVVGKKALEVAQTLGKRKNKIFVYQEEQKGTGDAVKKAIEHDMLNTYTGDVYVFPGDMGLLSEKAIAKFKRNFKTSNCSMMVMTGYVEGKRKDNYYGRIIKSKKDGEEIIEIKEYKDIIAINKDDIYEVSFKDQMEKFTKEELLNTNEFNAGVYAFKIDPLKKYINHLTPNNVQGEIYASDLTRIFNENGLKVLSSPVQNNNFVVAFNVKSVLKQMEDIFRGMVYEQLKDIITIDDADDFFIAEETVRKIIEFDKKFPALDIKLGRGVYLGENVNLNCGVSIERNAILKGNVVLGENVTIGENVVFSTYPNQKIEVGKNSTIFQGNVIKGEVKLGSKVRIEKGVRITGSSESPVIIGNNVLIKGITYIFGSIIENDLIIQHSILENVYVEKVHKKNGEVQPIKYIFPNPEGLDSISKLKK